MFIHIGGDTIIRSHHLIAIFDLSIEQSSKISRHFIEFSIKHENIERIGEEEPKSLVITENKIYYSPISSTTLKKRSIENNTDLQVKQDFTSTDQSKGVVAIESEHLR